MREIKFRAWTGTYYEDNFVVKFGKAVVLQYDEEIEKPNWILEQYTGLKDKNGLEIYESDIVKGRFEDEVSRDWHEICVITIDPYQPTCGFWEDCEVIGNIHQHPELLQ